jgi:D-citramalate synthase
MEAIKAGIKAYVTVNGMGTSWKRTAWKYRNQWFLAWDKINVKESSYRSELVETLRDIESKQTNRRQCFTQTAGIHADGDNKNNLYFNDLLPEHFGRKTQYALGKTSRLISKVRVGIKLNAEDLKLVTSKLLN